MREGGEGGRGGRREGGRWRRDHIMHMLITRLHLPSPQTPSRTPLASGHDIYIKVQKLG